MIDTANIWIAGNLAQSTFDTCHLSANCYFKLLLIASKGTEVIASKVLFTITLSSNLLRTPL